MKKIIILLALITSILSGCSTTTVQNEWKFPGYSPRPIRSVVVLGVPGNSMIGNQCADEFTRQLRERGISALPGYNDFPPGTLRKDVVAKARQMGREGVLVCRYMERRAQTEVYPAGYDTMMVGPDMEMWPPYQYVENEYDVFRTIFYDAVSGKAVWSAVSETLAGRSQSKVLRSYVKAILKKMEKEGIVGPEVKH